MQRSSQIIPIKFFHGDSYHGDSYAKLGAILAIFYGLRMRTTFESVTGS